MFKPSLLKWLLAVTLVVSAAVSAHQQKTAISTILFNPRTDNIEVMHRFNLHDAEHAVKQIFGKGADILDSTETQLQFSEYVAARFTLFDADNNNLALKKVGFEVDGKFFWVYQETAQIDNLQGIQVKHDALRDLWSSQTNTVNIEGMGDIKTLTFTQNIELLEVSFGHH